MSTIGRVLAVAAPMLLTMMTAPELLAQTPPATSQPPAPGDTSPAPAAPSPSGTDAQTPAAATQPAGAAPSAPAAPALTAKDLEGLDVFGSEGQAVGKVAKVNVVDGKVKSVEVQSGGWFGFFKKTYVVPVESLNKKGGRIELSMTSEQAKQLQQ